MLIIKSIAKKLLLDISFVAIDSIIAVVKPQPRQSKTKKLKIQKCGNNPSR